MLIEYIEVALKRARYTIIDDDLIMGKLRNFKVYGLLVSLLRNAEIVSKR